jgi:hypothetical protein
VCEKEHTVQICFPTKLEQVCGHDSQALVVVSDFSRTVIVAFDSISVQNFDSHTFVYNQKFKSQASEQLKGGQSAATSSNIARPLIPVSTQTVSKKRRESRNSGKSCGS